MSKIEIERKWVMKGMPPIKYNRKIQILQIYFPSENNNIRYRTSKEDGKVRYEKIIKTNVSYGTFKEIDFPITRDEFESIWDRHYPEVYKIRYVGTHPDISELNLEVDEYKYFPLLILEIEFPDEETMKSFVL